MDGNPAAEFRLSEKIGGFNFQVSSFKFAHIQYILSNFKYILNNSNIYRFTCFVSVENI